MSTVDLIGVEPRPDDLKARRFDLARLAQCFERSPEDVETSGWLPEAPNVMKDDLIERLARESGLQHIPLLILSGFAVRVAEECAKMVEGREVAPDAGYIEDTGDLLEGIAAAIRAKFTAPV